MQSGKSVTLALDTSGSVLMVSVQRAGKRVVRRRRGIKQERLLFPALQAALRACQVTLQDVRKICIVRGPGRFTGIRIALTFASMMKYLNQAEVYGATVFDILRLQVENSSIFTRFKKQHPNGHLGIVLHAFREEYFLQICDGSQAGPLWLSREELLKRLAQYPAPLLLAGTDKNDTDLSELTGGQYPLAAAKDCRVRPQTLLEISQQALFRQNALEPLYLKPARFELITPK